MDVLTMLSWIVESARAIKDGEAFLAVNRIFTIKSKSRKCSYKRKDCTTYLARKIRLEVDFDNRMVLIMNNRAWNSCHPGDLQIIALWISFVWMVAEGEKL